MYVGGGFAINILILLLFLFSLSLVGKERDVVYIKRPVIRGWFYDLYMRIARQAQAPLAKMKEEEKRM